MESRDGLLLWVLGGAGILFLYSAWSKQHPAAVLGKTLGTATSTAPAPTPAPGLAPGTITVPALPNFSSRLPAPVPNAYATAPQLHIPGTWNA